MSMKCHLNLSIDMNLVERSREKGLNLSNFLEERLRENLRMFEQGKLPNCKHSWGWAFCVPSGLAKECKICGEFRRVILETNKVAEKAPECKSA